MLHQMQLFLASAANASSSILNESNDDGHKSLTGLQKPNANDP